MIIIAEARRVTDRRGTDIPQEGKSERYYGSCSCSKEAILNRFRSSGYRITRQRELLVDILLEGSCSSCKEIYQIAKKTDPGIGFATVYRFLGTLEDLGVISRCNMFRMISL